MSEVTVVGLDLVKHMFQIHGADAASPVVVCKQLRRGQVLEFFSQQPACAAL